VWCTDLLRLFGHVRQRMDVDVHETALRRRALDEMEVVAS
jgi:hypothetical protein